jgi:hypothetical protein
VADPATVRTEVDVAVDEFCQAHLPAPIRPGPAPAPSPGEVVTLAICGQWTRFGPETAYHGYLWRELRPLFPTLPSRPQVNRAVRAHHPLIAAVAHALGRALAAGDDRAYEVVDGTGLVTRNATRRGRGWLWGQADIGTCPRLGWYEGVRLLVTVTPTGAITGWGIGPASANDRTLAETFFAARAAPQPGLPGVGTPVSDRYVADLGFSGLGCQPHWDAADDAAVVGAPQTGSKRAWSKDWRRWIAGIRQGIETVNDRLLFRRGLDRERPHAMSGPLARLAAAVGLHNVCSWLKRNHGRGLLCFADLIDWP